MGRKLAFLVASFVAVAVALLCALVPANLPTGRVPGSAFDPTTTAVALHSRPQSARDSERQLVGDPDGDRGTRMHGPDTAGALMPVPPSLGSSTIERAPSHLATQVAGPAFPPAASFQPRAPPAA